MISLILLIVSLSFLGAAWATHWNFLGLNITAGILGFIAGIAMLWLLIMPTTIPGEISLYEREKSIYHALDLSKLSDLKKADVLQPLLNLDSRIRAYQKDNKSFLLDLYIPDEIDKVELVKGWEE